MTEFNTQIIDGASCAGKQIIAGPLTTAISSSQSPGIMLNEIEKQIAKIFPENCPFEQFARLNNAVSAGAMTVDYYSVDALPNEAEILTFAPITGSSGAFAGKPCFKITTTEDAAFAPMDTILVPDISGAHDSGEDLKNRAALVLYVESRAADGSGINVVAINPDTDSDGEVNVQLDAGTRLIRMGRAAAELDVQTEQLESVPVKGSNNCQTFKGQYELSETQANSLQEVKWGVAEQEEVSLYNLKSSMERSFLFGTKARLTNRRTGDETLLTEGVWSQTRPSLVLTESVLSKASLEKIFQAAFTGDAATSKQKILFAGSDLLLRINSAYEGSVELATRWGLTFRRLDSTLGTLYVIHTKAFDDCNHASDGLIIDPLYTKKYVFKPLTDDELKLKEAGERNAIAHVLTETSCVCGTHVYANVRIIG